jgi:hypothetical protein
MPERENLLKSCSFVIKRQSLTHLLIFVDGVLSELKLHQEEKSLVMALRDTFLPRLHGRDASVFATLITDLWPYLNIPMVFGGEQDILTKPPPSRNSLRGDHRIRTAKSVESNRSLKGRLYLLKYMYK